MLLQPSREHLKGNPMPRCRSCISCNWHMILAYRNSIMHKVHSYWLAENWVSLCDGTPNARCSRPMYTWGVFMLIDFKRTWTSITCRPTTMPVRCLFRRRLSSLTTQFSLFCTCSKPAWHTVSVGWPNMLPRGGPFKMHSFIGTKGISSFKKHEASSSSSAGLLPWALAIPTRGNQRGWSGCRNSSIHAVNTAAATHSAADHGSQDLERIWSSVTEGVGISPATCGNDARWAKSSTTAVFRSPDSFFPTHHIQSIHAAILLIQWYCTLFPTGHIPAHVQHVRQCEDTDMLQYVHCHTAPHE